MNKRVTFPLLVFKARSHEWVHILQSHNYTALVTLALGLYSRKFQFPSSCTAACTDMGVIFASTHWSNIVFTLACLIMEIKHSLRSVKEVLEGYCCV